VKLLLTGGAGFIGSHVAKLAVANGHEVLIVDNLSSGFESNIPSGCRFMELSAESADLERDFKLFKPHAVFHIGGQSSGQISEEDPIFDCNSNVLSTLNLLNLCTKFGTQNFYFASSMSCYGDAKMENSELGWHESETCSPTSVYGAGKLCAEEYMKLFSARGTRCVSLRMFNVYGSGQNMQNQKQGMISIYLNSLLSHGNVLVKGSLQRKRDFVHISDVAHAWMQALNTPLRTNFEVFNICSGKQYSIAEILKALEKACGSYQIQETDGTQGDQFLVGGSALKAWNILKWKAEMPLEEGLFEFVRYEKNKRLLAGKP
jgi:UDP-glucose 4-epimerase